MNPIEQIKDRLSILDVVSTYVRLEKSGSQFKGRCPFHNEKTPSFYVSPSRNSYHCFGCSKGGDIFSFIQDIEHIPFREALELLAGRAGVELKSYKQNDSSNSILAVLEDATKFFCLNLNKYPSSKVYASSRGMSDETIENFRVGYAHTEWRSLYDYLRSLKYTDDDIEKSGLVIKTEKGYYDRFRGRLMFPISSPSGKVVGFTGRVMPEVEKASEKPLAKYVNTPETSLYHKSKILFGYDKAKQAMVDEDLCIVVEGQMDTIMTHQSGTKNVVGVSGTAFTDEQLTLILRMTRNIALSFDSDKAGQSALIRSAELALLSDANVEVINLGEDKDPADIVVTDPSKWKEAVAGRTHVVEYLLKKIRDEVTDDRVYSLEVRRVVIPLISSIKSHIDRDIFLKRVAEALGVDIEAVRTDLKNYVSTHVIASPVREDTKVLEKQNDNISKVLLTYEELVGILELHPEKFDEEVEKTLLSLYSLKQERVVPRDEFPESEKHKLEIKAEILNEDPDSRKRNFRASLLELKERILDIQIEESKSKFEETADENSAIEYNELLKQRNIIRSEKIAQKIH